MTAAGSPPDEVPPPGRVRFGDLRRLAPVSRVFGFDRGRPVDRHYIEAFLAHHAADVRGRVLEVGDDRYTRRFGGERVVRSDVLDRRADNPAATIVADLARDALPPQAFDCAIVTQTLQYVYDVARAVRALHGTLRPEGVLLLTLPGLSQVSPEDMKETGDFWRFTAASAARLLDEAFTGGHVRVETHGNVLAAVSFLHGIAAEELEPAELAHLDPDYPVTVAVRAVRAAA